MANDVNVGEKKEGLAAERTMSNGAKAAEQGWAGRVPHVKPGVYEDGLPIHEIQYLACKMMLKPNRFDSRESLFKFGDVVKEAAKETGVKFATKGFSKKPLKIRE